MAPLRTWNLRDLGVQIDLCVYCVYNQEAVVPTILLVDGFRFFFYSREEERMHIHVEYQGKVAKIWLDTFEIAENYGFKNFQLNYLQAIARKNEKRLKKAWIAYFG